MAHLHYFGENLRLIRVRRCLSQAELARRSGVGSQQYLSNLENGLRPSDENHLRLLATALDVAESSLTRRIRVGGSK
jgi:transcriptional regulator with XRE-family HTH domain